MEEKDPLQVTLSDVYGPSLDESLLLLLKMNPRLTYVLRILLARVGNRNMNPARCLIGPTFDESLLGIIGWMWDVVMGGCKALQRHTGPASTHEVVRWLRAEYRVLALDRRNARKRGDTDLLAFYQRRKLLDQLAAGLERKRRLERKRQGASVRSYVVRKKASGALLKTVAEKQEDADGDGDTHQMAT